MQTGFDDEELQIWIRKARGGDPDAMNRLFTCFYDQIFAFCFKLCCEREMAQDVCQETFIKVARSLSSYKESYRFKSWLSSIALNSMRDAQRARKRRREDSLSTEAAGEMAHNPPMADDSAIILAALSSMPDKEREAIVLICFEEENYTSAARITGCSAGTFAWRLHSAKRRLAHQLKSQGVSIQ